MYKEKRVGVVIPAYNEAPFVGEVIETVPEFVDQIYPVDDRSTDDTWAEIKRAASRVSTPDQAAPRRVAMADGGEGADRVVPLRHDRNRGVGAAIKTGYRRAAAEGCDVVAVMNGDGQMDPDDLHRILDPVVEGRADYAKGNRLFSPAHWSGMPTWRLFGNVLLTFLTRIASGYWETTDSQNGYTAISTAAIEEMDLQALYDRYGFLNDLLTRLNAEDMRVADVEMQAVYGTEDSAIEYRRFVPQLSWLLLNRFFWRLRAKYLEGSFHPTVLWYGLGVCGGMGMVLALALAVLGVGSGTAGAGGAFAASVVTLVLGMVTEWRRNRPLQLHVRR